MEVTIAQLKTLLDAYPDDTIVVVDSYEDGYDDFTLELKSVYVVDHPSWWEGQYEEATDQENNLKVLALKRVDRK